MLYSDLANRQVLWHTAAKQHGKSCRVIAKAWGVSAMTVWRAISREEARRKLPKFALLMPQHFTPQAPCPHGVIEDGAHVVCLVCHATGLDGHPDLIVKELPPDPPEAIDGDGLAGGLGKPKGLKL